MPEQLWSQVDSYITEKLQPADPALEAALDAARAADLPDIQVSANQGKFLHLLARLARARRILEIGTLGGYSTIWLARALPPDGRLTTLEIDERHAEVARSNLDRAGLGDRVDVRVGPALQSLDELTGPFDFVFIDADKQNNAAYFSWAVRLSHPGTVIVVDNVIRDGRVVDADSDDAAVQGTRRLFDVMGTTDATDTTVIQTVGVKGYDGFALAVVR
jgi:predicted O-methyltransferase YrrM